MPWAYAKQVETGQRGATGPLSIYPRRDELDRRQMEMVIVRCEDLVGRSHGGAARAALGEDVADHVRIQAQRARHAAVAFAARLLGRVRVVDALGRHACVDQPAPTLSMPVERVRLTQSGEQLQTSGVISNVIRCMTLISVSKRTRMVSSPHPLNCSNHSFGSRVMDHVPGATDKIKSSQGELTV